MSVIELRPTHIGGCFELIPRIIQDARGAFVKIFHQTTFAQCGLADHFAEQYFSLSHSRVLRGLHFQKPPHDHDKVVYCVSGSVLDAVVDLRTDSPTYGKFALLELTAERGNGIYVPAGLAHGFYVLSDTAIVTCKTTTVYAPEHDAGIKWDSASIPWPDRSPIVSERDAQLGPLAEFVSPFQCKPGAV